MTTVDREQLIRLLAERTGMDEDRVDQQFVELTDHIRQAETKRETFFIDGFGTFKPAQDRLEFVPADILATEINNKYAGMKPIELIGAFKEPDGTDIPVAPPPDEAEGRQAREKEKKPEVPGVNGKGSDSSGQGAPEAGPPTPTPSPELPAEAPPSPAPAAAVKTDETLDKDPLGKAIVIVAVILTLSVAGWLAYDFGVFGSGGAGSNNSSPAEQQRAEQQQSATLPGDQFPGEETGNTETSEQQPAEGNESPPSTVEAEPYGLYGEFNQDIDSGFYTIVVHSLRTMELAEEKRQGLVEEGFRTKINEADVNGSTYFRVGIGQFSTIRAAQEAIRELPEPYQNNNFINRF